MKMIATVAIGSTKQKQKSSEPLPIARIYETHKGKYIFLERSVIEEAITLSLKNLEAGQPSIVLIEVQVVPMSSRRRQITRNRNNLRN